MGKGSETATEVGKYILDPIKQGAEEHRAKYNPEGVMTRLAGGEAKKIDYYGKQHDKFVSYLENNEKYHTGSLAKGLAQGFVNGLDGGKVAGQIDGKEIELVLKNGGSFEEFSRLKKAANESLAAVPDNASQQDLKVVLSDYRRFCETASEKAGKGGVTRPEILADTERDLHSGQSLKQSVREIGQGKGKKISQAGEFMDNVDPAALAAASQLGGALTGNNVTPPDALPDNRIANLIPDFSPAFIRSC